MHIKPIVQPRAKADLQGEDGRAHMTYYDAERSLSFTWDGNNQLIEVREGSYGDPVTDTFARLAYTPNYASHNSSHYNLRDHSYNWIAMFRDACVSWIEKVWDQQPDAVAKRLGWEVRGTCWRYERGTLVMEAIRDHSYCRGPVPGRLSKVSLRVKTHKPSSYFIRKSVEWDYLKDYKAADLLRNLSAANDSLYEGR